ncbi:MAG: rhodanese-related sulfurtransferase [Parasphingorhabdus sp.]|nr:rhodanese-related sulfurtransferase [Parasphingorhabdus sp.]
MTMSQNANSVAAFYHFARLADPPAVQQEVRHVAQAAAVKGTILIATEGVNGTIAGPSAGVDLVIAELRALSGFAAMAVKYSTASEMPFLRLKVRCKREIVTMGVADIDAATGKGDYIAPRDWNAVIGAPDTILIDTRNGYESAIGSFANAIAPQTDSFRDFPVWFDEFASALPADRPPRIAMFCTGGIRCEKATAYVKAKGFDDVVHLHGGILKYLEEVPPEESLWQGECFLFDGRVALGHGLVERDFDLCHGCRMPLSAEDRASALFEEGVSCPHCHGQRSDAQVARYRERHAQVLKAAREGRSHLGDNPEPAGE